MENHTPEQHYQRLVDSYNAAIIRGSDEGLAQALAVPIPETVLRTPHLHADLRHKRGNALCRLGLNEVAEKEYGLGFYETLQDQKGDYLLDWGMASFAGLFTAPSLEGKNDAVARCFEVLELAERHAGDLDEPRYLMASIVSVRAFLFAFMGDAAQAGEQLGRINAELLSSGFIRDDPSLAAFFTQYPKGLLAGLELNDPILLRRLSHAVLSVEEAQFVQSQRMTPGEQFLFAVSIRVDVPKFRDSWTGLLEAVHLLFPRYPRSRRFRALISSSAEPEELAAFLDSRQ